MTKWVSGPMAALDTETDGVSVWESRILTAAVVEIRPGRRPVTRSWVINPGDGYEVPADAAAVNGLTGDYLRAHGMPAAVALDEITSVVAGNLNLDIPVVVANAPFDCTLLESECLRHDVPTLASRVKTVAPIVDPLVLDKHCDPYRKGVCADDKKNPCPCGATNKTLTSLCMHYGVTLTDAHTAAADALAAARLFPRILARFPELEAYTIGQLHHLQVGWRAEQLASFASYLRRMGEHDKAADVEASAGWPLQPRPTPVLF